MLVLAFPLNDFQFGKFQHQLFRAVVVEMDSGFLVGSGTVDRNHRAFAEFLVHHAEPFLDEIGIGGFERT